MDRADESAETGKGGSVRSVGEVAHELGNIVTILLGSADALQGADRCADPAAARALAIEQVRVAGRRAAALVKELRSFAPSGSGDRSASGSTAGVPGAPARRSSGETVPNAAGEVESPPRPLPPRARSGGPGASVVLLCEDDALVRSLLAETIRVAGYSVIEASRGVEALERAEKGRIDLLICDVVLPGMDGPTLLGRLRAGEPGLPCILISGYSREVVERTLARRGGGGAIAGTTEFLEKPFSPTELMARVERALGARSSMDGSSMDGSSMNGSSASGPSANGRTERRPDSGAPEPDRRS